MPITLIDILLRDRKITAAEADSFRRELRTKRITEEDSLLAKLPEEIVFEAKSKFYGVPLKKLDEDHTIPPEMLTYIPEEAARTYKFIALSRIDSDTIEVGMVNPQDVRVLDALKFTLTSKNVNAKILLITPKQFEMLFQQYSSLHGEVKEALQNLEEDIADIDAMAGPKIDTTELTANAPIARVVAVIFKHAFEGNASDVHIEPLDKNTRVRFRVDGILHTSLLLPKSIHAAIVSRIKILTNMKIDESRVPQDGRFRSRISGSIIDFRVATFPTINGEKVVMRLLDPFAGVKSLEELGFVGTNLEMIKRAVQKPYGMILITGPTGSGKSTTLQSLLGTTNKEGANLVSLEDPVEYNIEGVNQSPVRPELGYTYALGLRSILRQDPDIVMVGEIRDAETAQLAVHAALTGHVVLTTLHTNNAIGVIPRLVDMGVESYLVPSAVVLAVAQRLVRKLCNDCKQKVPAEGRAKKIIEETVAGMPDDTQAKVRSDAYWIWEAPGCGKCAHKGTKGRLAIAEALEMTPELKRIVIEGITEEKIINESKRQNMLTMIQDGVMKVLDGMISLEEVLQSTV
ncbi:type II/IV secretion system protein [Candidatus Azambacteria bacterium]|nr:type II/IV secretion system protein [Candidatus Azambacteria bacterium]MBI3685356.1 type II/IV secretion system protein [Candidatus Azambacteria bacterium]